MNIYKLPQSLQNIFTYFAYLNLCLYEVDSVDF